jgi:hypothetical protein
MTRNCIPIVFYLNYKVIYFRSTAINLIIVAKDNEFVNVCIPKLIIP